MEAKGATTVVEELPSDFNWDEFIELSQARLDEGTIDILCEAKSEILDKTRKLNIECCNKVDDPDFYPALLKGFIKRLSVSTSANNTDHSSNDAKDIEEILKIMKESLSLIIKQFEMEGHAKSIEFLIQLEKVNLELKTYFLEELNNLDSNIRNIIGGFLNVFEKLLTEEYFIYIDSYFNELDVKLSKKSDKYLCLAEEAHTYVGKYNKEKSEQRPENKIKFINYLLIKCMRLGQKVDIKEFEDPDALVDKCSEIVNINALNDAAAKNLFNVENKFGSSSLQDVMGEINKILINFNSLNSEAKKKKLNENIIIIIHDIIRGIDIIDKVSSLPSDQIATFLRNALLLLQEITCTSDEYQDLCMSLEDNLSNSIRKFDLEKKSKKIEESEDCNYYSELEKLLEVVHYSAFKKHLYADIPSSLRNLIEEIKVDGHRRCLFDIYQSLKESIPEILRDIRIYSDDEILFGSYIKELFEKLESSLVNNSPEEIKKSVTNLSEQYKLKMLKFRSIDKPLERVVAISKDSEFSNNTNLLKKCIVNLLSTTNDELKDEKIDAVSNTILPLNCSNQKSYLFYMNMLQGHLIVLYSNRIQKRISEDRYKILRPYLQATIDMVMRFYNTRDQLEFYLLIDSILANKNEKIDEKQFVKEISRQLCEKFKLNFESSTTENLRREFGLVKVDDKSRISQDSIKILSLLPLYYFDYADKGDVVALCCDIINTFDKEKYNLLRLDLCMFLIKKINMLRIQKDSTEEDILGRFYSVCLSLIDLYKKYSSDGDKKSERERVRIKLIKYIQMLGSDKKLNSCLSDFEEDLELILSPVELEFCKVREAESVDIALVNGILKSTNSNVWLEALSKEFIKNISYQIASICFGSLPSNDNISEAIAEYIRNKKCQMDAVSLKFIRDNLNILFETNNLPSLHLASNNLINTLNDYSDKLSELINSVKVFCEIKNKLIISLSYAKKDENIESWPSCARLIIKKSKEHHEPTENLENILDVFVYYDHLDEFSDVLSQDNGPVALFMQNLVNAAKKAVIIDEEFTAYLNNQTNFDIRRFDFPLGHKCLIQLSKLLTTRISKGSPTLSFDSFKKLYDLILLTNAHHNEKLLERVKDKDYTVWWIELKTEEIMRIFSINSSETHDNKLMEFKVRLVDSYILFEKKYSKSIIDEFIQFVKKVKGGVSSQVLYTVIRQFQSNRWDLNKNVIEYLQKLPDSKSWLDKSTDEAIRQIREGQIKGGQRSVEQIMECIRNDNTGTNLSIMPLATENQGVSEGLPQSVFEPNLFQFMHLINERLLLLTKENMSKAMITKWASNFKALGPNKLEQNINVIDLCAVLMQAVLDCDKHLPRNTQMCALLIFIDGIRKHTGRLSNISTSEGKTLITQMLAITRALNNEVVDVFTSSTVYAQRDAKLAVNLLSYFNVSVTNNCDTACESEEERKKRYAQAQVIYGDTGAFQRDYLLTKYLEKDIRPNGKGDCAIVDEADSSLLDNASKTLYISHSIEDMQYLRDLFIIIWSAVQNNDVYVHNDANVEKVLKIIQSEIDDGGITVPQSKYMKAFIKRRLKIWINNAYNARDLSEGDQYTIAKQSSKKGQALVMDLSTGVEQLNTQWSNGLHQFIQMKHGNKLTDESLKAIFISNLAFFRLYTTNLNGMTGSLGNSEERKFMHDFYSGLDFFVLPRFKPERFIMEDAVIVPTMDLWIKAVNEDVKEKLDPQAKLEETILSSQRNSPPASWVLIDDDFYDSSIIQERNILDQLFGFSPKDAIQILEDNIDKISSVVDESVLNIFFSINLHTGDSQNYTALMEQIKLLSTDLYAIADQSHVNLKNAYKDKNETTISTCKEEIKKFCGQPDLRKTYVRMILKKNEFNPDLFYALVQFQNTFVQVYSLDHEKHLIEYSLKGVDPRKFTGKVQKRLLVNNKVLAELKPVPENLNTFTDLIKKYSDLKTEFEKRHKETTKKIPVLQEELQNIQSDILKLSLRFALSDEAKANKIAEIESSLSNYQNLLKGVDSEKVSESKSKDDAALENEKEEKRKLIRQKITQLQEALSLTVQTLTFTEVNDKNDAYLKNKATKVEILTKLTQEADNLSQKIESYQRKIARLEKSKEAELLAKNGKRSRSVLIICENQLNARSLHQSVTENYPLVQEDFIDKEKTKPEFSQTTRSFKEKKIVKYDTALQEFQHDAMAPGDIIVATNIAGRGMDLDTVDQLEKNDGLGVDLTTMPEDERTVIQIFGRTARAGRNGSGRFIIYDPRAATQPVTISMLIDERDERASARMALLRRTKVPRMMAEEKLFNKFTALQDEVRKSMRDSMLDDEYVKLQIKSLQDRWAFWLDEHEEDLNDIYESGDDYLNAQYEKFATQSKKDLYAERYGLVDSIGELYKLARFFFKRESFIEAERCYDLIIELEPEYSGFAHYYKAQAIFGQDKRVELSGKKSARDHLKLAVKKLEAEISRLASANQIVKVLNERRQVRGDGTEVDYFTASNINMMSFLTIHIDAAKEVLGQELSDKVLTSGPIIGEEAEKTFDHLRKHNPDLVKDFRISHKVKFKYELFWRKHLPLNLDAIKDPDLKNKINSAEKRLVIIDQISDADKKVLETQGVSCKRVIVRQKYKNKGLEPSNTSIIRFSTLFAPVNDKVVNTVENSWLQRCQAKKQVQDFRGSGALRLSSALSRKNQVERFNDDAFNGILFTRENFVTILTILKSTESYQYRLHEKYKDRIMGAEAWQDDIFCGKGIEIKLKLLSSSSLRSRDELCKEIESCLDQTDKKPEVIDKIIEKLTLKDQEIFVCERAYMLTDEVIKNLSNITTHITLNHPLTPEQFKFLNLGDTLLSSKMSALFQHLSVKDVVYDAKLLKLSEEEFDYLWKALNDLGYLKYDVYACIPPLSNKQERDKNIPLEYQSAVAITLIRMFLEYKVAKEGKITVKIPESAIPFSHNLSEDINSLKKQLIDQQVLKKPSPRFPLNSNPDQFFASTKQCIADGLDSLLESVNKDLMDKIRNKEKEIKECTEQYPGLISQQLLDLYSDLNNLKQKKKEYESTLTKVFETLIGKIRFFEKLKISKKTLDDYLKDGKMPPEIVDFTRRCLFEVMSLIKDVGFSWDAFFCAILGVLQIIAGCVLSMIGGGIIGQILIREGVGDIVYAVQAGISGNFSWEAYAERKLISLAMSVVMTSASFLIDGKEFFGAACHNIQASTLISSVGKEVLAHLGEALIEISVNQAASALIDSASKSILEGLVNALVSGIESSEQIKQMESTLREDYRQVHKKFGDLDARAIASKILQDGNLAQLVQSKVSSHALRYIQMAMQSLSKLSNNGGSILKTIGKVAEGLSLIGAYAGSVKVAAEIVGDVESIMRDMQTELKEMHNTKKPRAGMVVPSDTDAIDFAQAKVDETKRILIEQAKAVVNNAVLTPVLQSGLKYVADRMTEGTLQSLMKDANELRERARIEMLLQKHDSGEKLLSTEDHLKYVIQLSTLKGGSLHSAASLMKEKGSAQKVMIGSKEVSLAAVVKDSGGEQNVYLNKKEDGYHVVKLDYQEMLSVMNSKDMPGDFSLRILATHEQKKIVLLDPDTFLPHENIEAGFEPVGSEADGEIYMVLGKDGKLSPCANENGQWKIITAPNDQSIETKVAAAANLARQGGGRSPAGMTAQQEQEIAQYLKDAVQSAEGNTALKDAYDNGFDDSNSPFRLMSEHDQFWQTTQLGTQNQLAFLHANSQLFNHKLTPWQRAGAGAMGLMAYTGAGLAAYGAAVTSPTIVGAAFLTGSALYSFDKGNQYFMEALTGQDSISLFPTLLSFGVGYPAASFIDDATGWAFAAPGLYQAGRAAFRGIGLLGNKLTHMFNPSILSQELTTLERAGVNSASSTSWQNDAVRAQQFKQELLQRTGLSETEYKKLLHHRISQRHTMNLDGKVKVYRAEGPWNERVIIDSKGNVYLNNDETMLFVNFDNPDHATYYWHQKLAQDSRAQLKSFEVKGDVFLRARLNSRPQHWNKFFPNSSSSSAFFKHQLVDSHLGHDIYGLERSIFEELQQTIVPGSGRIYK